MSVGMQYTRQPYRHQVWFSATVTNCEHRGWCSSTDGLAVLGYLQREMGILGEKLTWWETSRLNETKGHFHFTPLPLMIGMSASNIPLVGTERWPDPSQARVSPSLQGSDLSRCVPDGDAQLTNLTTQHFIWLIFQTFRWQIYRLPNCSLCCPPRHS